MPCGGRSDQSFYCIQSKESTMNEEDLTEWKAKHCFFFQPLVTHTRARPNRVPPFPIRSEHRGRASARHMSGQPGLSTDAFGWMMPIGNPSLMPVSLQPANLATTVGRRATDEALTPAATIYHRRVTRSYNVHSQCAESRSHESDAITGTETVRFGRSLGDGRAVLATRTRDLSTGLEREAPTFERHGVAVGQQEEDFEMEWERQAAASGLRQFVSRLSHRTDQERRPAEHFIPEGPATPFRSAQSRTVAESQPRGATLRITNRF